MTTKPHANAGTFPPQPVKTTARENPLHGPPGAGGAGILNATHRDKQLPTRNGSEVRPSVNAGGGRVLVVDDDAVVRDVLERMLRLNGHDVIVAAGGEEAVALYRTLSEVVDLVMLDLCMPGMDGYETFRQLRSVRADARVILCSGTPDSRRVESALADGACAFLGKPFGAAQVLDVVQRALARNTGETCGAPCPF